MRIIAMLTSLIIAAVGGYSPVLAADTPSPIPTVSGICALAFSNAAEAVTPDGPIDVLDVAVRSCASLDEWLIAAKMHPAAIGDADPRAFLDARCNDTSTGLASYATCYGLGYATVVPETGSLSVHAPAGSEGTRLAEGVGVEIILDTSGSMLEEIAGVRRIDIAKDSLAILVRDALAEGLPVALRTFGGESNDRAARCQSTLTAPLAPLDRRATLDLVNALGARKRTRSPIATSLIAVAEDLAEVAGRRSVVLVTDGDETCGGDPIAAIEGLRAGGIDLNLNVVGFALEDDDELRARMAAWAEAGAGQYFDAANANELAAAITSAITSSIRSTVGAPIQILGQDGTIIASGTVDGDAIVLEPGTYRVEILLDPPVEFSDVVVGNGDRVMLELPKPNL